MPPPTLMRHRSAIGRLQADDDARVQQAAAAIMDGLYAPPGDDGAEPATGYAQTRAEWRQRQASSAGVSGGGATSSGSAAPDSAGRCEDDPGSVGQSAGSKRKTRE